MPIVAKTRSAVSFGAEEHALQLSLTLKHLWALRNRKGFYTLSWFQDHHLAGDETAAVFDLIISHGDIPFQNRPHRRHWLLSTALTILDAQVPVPHSNSGWFVINNGRRTPDSNRIVRLLDFGRLRFRVEGQTPKGGRAINSTFGNT